MIEIVKMKQRCVSESHKEKNKTKLEKFRKRDCKVLSLCKLSNYSALYAQLRRIKPSRHRLRNTPSKICIMYHCTTPSSSVFTTYRFASPVFGIGIKDKHTLLGKHKIEYKNKEENACHSKPL